MAAKLKVLVACEFSAVVREAFQRLGHDATSCDLLPSEVPGPHLIGDALDVLTSQAWDLAICHPPCTYLTNAGVRWLYGSGKSQGIRDEKRWADLRDGAAFFRAFFDQFAGPLCVENPIMHSHAAALIGAPANVAKSIVQPYQFGHLETKATVLWLRDLVPLRPTEDVEAQMRALPKAQTNRVHLASPGPDRWKMRSRTFPGIAEAMALQWGGRVSPSVSFSQPSANLQPSDVL